MFFWLVSAKLVIQIFFALSWALSPGLMRSLVICVQSSHTATTLPGLEVTLVSSPGLC